MSASPETADLLDFLASSPTPYHAVESAIRRLEAAGFTRLEEAAPWTEIAGKRHYVVHEGTAILAFIVPTAATAASAAGVRGFRIVGAHTDSPNLRLKPKPEYTKEGYAQLGVEVYGGVLLNSWLDRDLSLAGRVLVRRDGQPPEARLVRIERPLLRVPQLAIHLERDVNDRGLVLNKQEHMAPVLGLVAMGGEGASGANDLGLGALVGDALGIAPTSIVGLDLMLYDVVPPTLAGRSNELLFSARLDNQAMCHAAIRSLVACADAAADRPVIPLVVLFDHEEVGSNSTTGAASALLPRVLERIVLALGGGREELLRTMAGSVCCSADMSHAVHPNYAERSEARHRPQLNGGPVIKVNAQQRYATSARTAALFADLCRETDAPVQMYAHRTDLPCGSTIGPITSTLLGIPTVDVGNPMLSMHSIREMAGAKDPETMTRVLTRFYGRVEV